MWSMRSIVKVIEGNPATWGYPHERHNHSYFYLMAANSSRILVRKWQIEVIPGPRSESPALGGFQFLPLWVRPS